MVPLKESKYVNKMNLNDKGQSPNFKWMSNDKCLKIYCPPINPNSAYTGEDAQWEKDK